MFFVDSDNEIINVNAIMILPCVDADSEKGTREVLMVNGSVQHMYVKDIARIRALVIS